MTNSERSLFASSTSASLSRATTCVRPWRSRRSMKTSEPRSRIRCTQPSSTTSCADVGGREFAVRMRAREVSERLDVHIVPCPMLGAVAAMARDGADGSASARTSFACCSGLHVLHRHFIARTFVGSDDGDELHAAQAAYLNCFPSLSGSGYTSTRRPAARKSAASFSASSIGFAFEQRDHHVGGRASPAVRGNILRSVMTTRIRSRPSEKPHAGICSPENIPMSPS